MSAVDAMLWSSGFAVGFMLRPFLSAVFGLVTAIVKNALAERNQCSDDELQEAYHSGQFVTTDDAEIGRGLKVAMKVRES